MSIDDWGESSLEKKQKKKLGYQFIHVNADKIYDGLVAFQVICYQNRVKYMIQSEVFSLIPDWFYLFPVRSRTG